MTRKGHYEVVIAAQGAAAPPPPPAPADASFRACTMALFIFLLACVVINVVVWLLVVGRGSGGGESKPEAGAVTGVEKTPEAVAREAVEADHRGDPDEHIIPEATGVVGNACNTTECSSATNRSSKYTSDSKKEPPVRKTVVSDDEPSVDGAVEREEIAHDLPETEEADVDVLADLVPPTFPPTLPPTPPPPPKPQVCKRVECKQLSAQMLATMGHSANPCTNFYDYACGGVLRNKYLLTPDYEAEAWIRIRDEIKNVTASSSETAQKLKKLFDSCNSYDPSNHIITWKHEVLEEMKTVGNFSFVSDDFVPNLTELFLRLLQHDTPVLLEVRLDVDDARPDRFAPQVLPWRLAAASLAAQRHCLRAVAPRTDLNLFYEEVVDCATNGEGLDITTKALKEALTVLNFTGNENIENIVKEYSEFLRLDNKAIEEKVTYEYELDKREKDEKTAAEMTEFFQFIELDWGALVKGLIGRPLNDSTEKIHFYGGHYFKKIIGHYNDEAGHRRLNDALLGAWAASRAWQLRAQWRGASEPERELECARAAARLLPDAAAALYVRTYSDAERRNLSQTIENLFIEVKDSMYSELRRARWLNLSGPHADIFNAIADRVNFMAVDNFRNITDTFKLGDIDNELKTYEIDSENFLANAIKLMARNRQRMYKRINAIPKENIWTHFIAPYETTGASIYSLNTIAIPLGATEKPFFNPQFPHYIQMAGLGSLIAHEVAHQFDLVGIRFANLTRDNEDTYETKTFVKDRELMFSFTRHVSVQYLNETEENRLKNLHYKFNGGQFKVKMNELQTDMTGIRLAFRAFMNNIKLFPKQQEVLPYLPLDTHQGFFVHFGQMFCTEESFFTKVTNFFEDRKFPSEVRLSDMVDVYLNNDFATAFNCSRATQDREFPYGPIEEEETGPETDTEEAPSDYVTGS